MKISCNCGRNRLPVAGGSMKPAAPGRGAWAGIWASLLLGCSAVKKGNVVVALDKIQERERLMRLNEIMAREAFYEKGFKKGIRKQKFNKWKNQYKVVMSQAKWMTLLQMKGVPVPGEKRRDLL